MKYPYLLIVPSIFVFSACGQPQAEKEPSAGGLRLKNETPDTGGWNKPVIEKVELNFQTTFRFEDISATITGLEADDQPTIAESGADTISITRQDLGLIPYGTSMRVQSGKLTDIRVECSFRNVAGVWTENGICCLYGWKQPNSPWKQLEKNSTGAFVTPEITEEDQQRFSKVDLREWKEEVKKRCGVEGVTDMRKLPAFVALDEIYFRISGTRPTGEKVNRIIQIIIPID